MTKNEAQNDLNERTRKKQLETGAYYDMLYNFNKVVTRANSNAMDGMEPRHISVILQRTANTFLELCGIDLTEPVKGDSAAPDRTGSIQNNEALKPEAPKTELKEPQTKPKHRVVLRSNLKVKNGWGICPVCGGKCIRINRNTILVNFAMFCKRCKLEHVVTWRYEPEKQGYPDRKP